MAPKKGQKMSLNEFLGDDTLGSWADEMDALPTAPAARGDDDRGDRRGGRDDFLSSRQDRQAFPPREDLPLPTQPPYTAFTKSVKVIKDRDERPKGFGYVEFEDLDDLKAALAKTGASLAGRTVRVSVAEPPKERSGPGGFDDPKFSGEWRRQGPLPDRDSSRRRFDGPPTDRSAAAPPSVSDTSSDWRSNPRRCSRRKNSSSFASESAADKEETWTIGSKFKPSEDEGTGRKFGSFRARGDMPPPSGPPESSTDNDWRSAPRAGLSSRSSTSRMSMIASSSGYLLTLRPPSDIITRRKLELLPRSGNTSTTPSPLASPKMAQSNPANRPSPSAPLGSPVDVTAREKVIAERLDKEREVTKDRVGQHSCRAFCGGGWWKRDEESKEDEGPKVNDITEQLGEVRSPFDYPQLK
ncbi:hypothetical protein EDB87DRAFT_1628776 [Lactarius vividus]|nr:hypothetical protein EDB87DRAFT_1628776 [Lactarius vividus]